MTLMVAVRTQYSVHGELFGAACITRSAIWIGLKLPSRYTYDGRVLMFVTIHSKAYKRRSGPVESYCKHHLRMRSGDISIVSHCIRYLVQATYYRLRRVSTANM